MNNLLKDKTEIIAWLDRHGVKNYTLHRDEKYGYVVEVAGDVDLKDKGLEVIAVKFGSVSGNFNCHKNSLTSLRGCPTVVGGNFYGGCNRLTSLKGAPKNVGAGFYCFYNQLKNLRYCPAHVVGDFKCNNNCLTSLEFCPRGVGRSFSCAHNQITSLEFCPGTVGEKFYCSDNKILNLEHCPQFVGKKFHCDCNENLGNIQSITDFNQIYQIHQEIVNIRQEKEKLSKTFLGSAKVQKNYKI